MIRYSANPESQPTKNKPVVSAAKGRETLLPISGLINTANISQAPRWINATNNGTNP